MKAVPCSAILAKQVGAVPAGKHHNLLVLAAATHQSRGLNQQAKQQQGPDVSLLSPKLQQ